MFDLLGLPMCNTGLSLFRMTCRSASGPRFGDRPCALAVAATEKWKMKRKATNTKKNAGDGAALTPTQQREPQDSAAARQQSSSLYGPGKRGATVQQQRSSETCNSPVSPVWGNGRDWRKPVDSEGDWVRVFPFATPAQPSPPPTTSRSAAARPPSLQHQHQHQHQQPRPASSSPAAPVRNDTARAMIKDIQEYLRCCKKVARSYEGLTDVPDDELNEKLKDLYPAGISKIWLPPN